MVLVLIFEIFELLHTFTLPSHRIPLVLVLMLVYIVCHCRFVMWVPGWTRQKLRNKVKVLKVSEVMVTVVLVKSDN